MARTLRFVNGLIGRSRNRDGEEDDNEEDAHGE